MNLTDDDDDELIELAAQAMHEITIEPIKFPWSRVDEEDKIEYRKNARACLDVFRSWKRPATQ